MAEDGPNRKDWDLRGNTVVRSTKEVNLAELEEIAKDLEANGGHLEIEGTGSGHGIKVTPVLTVVKDMPAPEDKTS